MRISRDSSFDRAFSRKTKSRGKSSVHEPNKEYELQRIYGASQSRNQRKSRGRSRDRTMTSDDDEGIVSRSLAAHRQRDKSLDDWERRMLMKSRKATPVKPTVNRFTDSENESPDRGKKKEGYSNWGPQTKHASIAGRLASMSLTSPGSSAKGSRKLEYDDMINDYFEPKPTNIVYEEAKSPRVKAIPDDEAESTYMEKLQVQKDRVSRIRKARHSAEVIQKAWRKYQARKKRF
ncbi:hypothetical protein FSP39_012383 [Pinctada imbricata]|uniref:Uncharacterized protein n=1 Tax=Pinctada imbricata TaxID=66713 RepID=A0AA89BZN3_PINIB|nr:hypothetical protein FSP39_012383 [Pinctada imbricata]